MIHINYKKNNMEDSLKNGGTYSSTETKMVLVPFNTPSSKNSKIATSKGVFHSKTTGKYLSALGISHYSSGRKETTLFKTKPLLFPVKDLVALFANVKYPCEVGLHFVRDKKTKFDFHNISQIIFDLLVAFDIIEDDNLNCVVPYVHKIEDRWYSIDKEHPGCWITIKNQ